MQEAGQAQATILQAVDAQWISEADLESVLLYVPTLASYLNQGFTTASCTVNSQNIPGFTGCHSPRTVTQSSTRWITAAGLDPDC